FQAEDGIRDFHVTGVQTCALPIYFVASGLGLVFLSPLFLVIAVWVKVDSDGPVFFRQERVGRFGKVFKIHKFRTMKVDAEAGGQIGRASCRERLEGTGGRVRRDRT